MKSLFLATAAVATALAVSAEAATSKRVEFTSAGERMVGELYLPDGHRAGEKLPTVVVTGAWMTVRQQMPARYAAELADRGYAALVFDFRGWGESGGQRRQVEDPASKIADIRAAVRFAATLPQVNASRIGGLGICASSGYMVTAANQTPELGSVALVAPWLHDREIVLQTYGGAEGVAKLEAAGDKAEAEFRRTGRQAFVPAASTTDERAVMFKAPYYTETDRGQIPAWRNEVDLSFWRGWLGFDAMRAAPALRQPFLMVHSQAAAIPLGAQRFYAAVSAPKQELWLEDVGQLDFYDRAEPVRRSADAVAKHFKATLG
jgi:dienelactone hydrolase